jgi:PadR family transcriptional regulator, regulatory protein AphA
MSPRRKSNTPYEIILLGLLFENPMHGYDLYKIISQPGGLSEVWYLSQSNLYAMLEDLEKQGLLISHLIQIGNSPVRKEYHLTSSGLSTFEKWMQEPVLHGRDMRQMFMAKFYFAVKDSPESASQLIKKQQSIAEAWKSDIQTLMNELTVEDEYDRLVLQSRLKQINGWIEWLDECAQSQIVSRRD